jgi:hypothetical protein
MYSMVPAIATHNRLRRFGRFFGLEPGFMPAGRCYVHRPLGESGKSAGTRRLPGSVARIAIGIALFSVTLGLLACGSGQRQDVTEPSGDFPVAVTTSKFPASQSLAQTADLELGVRNAGKKTIPNLAITIWTGPIKAGVTSTGSGQGSFNIRENNPNLADPNRPVWILEQDYPKLLGPGVTTKNLDRQPPAGAQAAQTDTFQFGAISPGDTKAAVWRVTPIRAGTYTVHYQVSAGLEGNAKAVSTSGGPVKGDFGVHISSKPPQTCVNSAGKVLTNCGP